MATVPNPDATAIYCRRSAKGDKQQVTVNRQKRLALDDCQKLGLIVVPHNIFIDNGASAWQRDRKRPGWDELIAACKRGEIKHIVCYHPDRLMRQPRDLEELLSISDQYGITLYGRLNERNLQDPDDRYALRIEIAHACRTSDDASRRLKDKFQEMAEAGLYNGARPFGYSQKKGQLKIIPKEAEIVREIFDRFTRGEAMYAIAADMNARGIRTATGLDWRQSTVRKQLHSSIVAGISIYQGEEIGVGKWQPIITREQWDFAQEMMTIRAAAQETRLANRRVYILRGLVVCGKCGSTMVGCGGKEYRCSRAGNARPATKCTRTMRAEPLEKFVEDAAILLLEKLAISPKRTRTAAIETAEREIESDERQLAELHDMWLNKEIDSAEYRRDRRVIQARILENQKKTVVKVKSPDAVKDLIGPNAKARWATLTDERKNSVLRFLFSAVIIGEGTANRVPRTIDYGRIEIEENELA